MTKSLNFELVFDELAGEMVEQLKEYNLPEEGIAYVREMLYFTVPGGKMNRGLTVCSALQSILKRQLSETETLNANILGWCVEWLQAFFLVADDIMDDSKTRRGQPCWYRFTSKTNQTKVGLVAINDSFLLESMIYKIIKKHFRSTPYYADVLDLFHEVTYQTELGQLMDLLTAPEDRVDLSKFSIRKHAYIVEYKTAYYSFYLPIALSMIMAGITDEAIFKQALAILLPLGEYFQVQDDYLDCYGNPEIIGKIGTDIMDNKCSWLINQALALASPEQRRILDENYGRKDPVKEKIVKDLFAKLKLEDAYKKYEEESYTRINDLIQNIDDKVIPKEMFIDFMNRIYKRNK